MSSTAFSRYARYYDLLNREKDYAGEARLVDGWLRRAGARPGPLLDIGCGTGAHARELAGLGWKVTGVDLSPAMIQIAREKTPPESGIEFSVGAAAGFNLDRRFSAAVSLFHVASYQTETDDLRLMLENVRGHLQPGGIFIFDFWHGPGVLADPPVVRTRRLEDASLRVNRTARPTHRPERCLVEVDYELLIEDVPTGQTERIQELHRLRYFFRPELRSLLQRAGFAVEQELAGLSENELDDRAWYGLMVAAVKG